MPKSIPGYYTAFDQFNTMCIFFDRNLEAANLVARESFAGLLKAPGFKYLY